MANLRGTRRIMQVMAPFENVSAKFALVREKAGINNGGTKYFGARLIMSPTRGMITNFYMRKYGRSSQWTSKELNLREVFTQSVKGANHIKEDLTQISRALNMWTQSKADSTKRCNGVNAKGYTFPGWVRAVQYKGGYAAYIEPGGGDYNYNTFPAKFDE